MQKYLLPAKRYIEKIIPQFGESRGYFSRRRIVVFAMAITFVAVTMIGFVTVRAMVGTQIGADSSESKNNSAYEVHAKGNTMTTSSSSKDESNNQADKVPHANTNVWVNNQSVDVPENGSVSKTFSSQDGMTRVDISNNTSSSGGNFSSSVSSTNISSNTYTQDVNIRVSSP